MARKIFGLYGSAVERVEEACGKNVFDRKEHNEFSSDLYDVELYIYVILKIYEDTIMVDLAGRKEFISFDDFERMEIE